MDGLVALGMREDALRLARRIFKNPIISGDAFKAALNAVLTQSDHTKPSTKLVDSAYARLTKRGQQSVRFLLLAFHSDHRNYGVAHRFLPKRFNGPRGLVELAFAMESMLGLKRMKEAEQLARKFPAAIALAEAPRMKTILTSKLAEYSAHIYDHARERCL